MKKYICGALVLLLVFCSAAFLLVEFMPASASENAASVPSSDALAANLSQASQNGPDSLLAGIKLHEEFNPNLFLNELTTQWGLTYLSVENIWKFSLGKPEVIVAVLDTGIDASHPDLAGQVIQEVNFSGSPTTDDLYGHGTHIAGIIAANLDNLGITGIAPSSRLFNVKVAEDNGTSSAENIARGIMWSVDKGASIINISIQLESSSDMLNTAIEYARTNGVIIVAAAGNNCFGKTIYPGSNPGTIAVTGLTPEGKLSPLANIADWVDYALPGYNIYSTMPGDIYVNQTGTSFATAHMSGIMALLYSLAIDLEVETPVYDVVLDLLSLISEKTVIYNTGVNVLQLKSLNSFN